ncbi:hypothetical protein CVT24_002117 [Panaeolus cyanescens]|uniref:Retrovirus-related Pol polyprotein from transposon TNT 1-94-like beta-barrel domain-containing protein n=1 Tax=Panaeolus cyanescens TaxID=181874 RepID=A0A409WVC5_9AGAR|nr:hypothetical protein CVT24_002117 [Panaeolus cyanescens]
MGPGKSDYSGFLKLKEDGTNWPAYKVEVLQHMYARGIDENLDNTAIKPEQLVAHNNKVYLATDTKHENPLDRERIKTLQAEHREYRKCEGIGTEILIATVPVSTFVQLRHYDTLAERWNALCTIYEHCGEDVSFDMWDRFHDLHFPGGSVQAFISEMSDMRDQLILNDADLSDKQFVAAIRRAFRQSEYNEFLASVCAGIRNAGKEITPNVLIQELKTEANSRHGASAIALNNKKLTALASSGPGSHSTNNSGKKGKKKTRDSKTKPKYHCENCGLDGHSIEWCWGPGGEIYDSSPQWWQDKQAELSKKNHTANTAETESSNRKPDHVALLANHTSPTSITDTTTHTTTTQDNTLTILISQLIKMLGEGATPLTESADAKPKHIALATHKLPCISDVKPLTAPSYALQSSSPYLGAVLDSDHFTPCRDALTNFTPFKETTHVADGRIVDALGKGDLTISVPCGNLTPTKVTLSNVYYVPSFSFTLVSIACILFHSNCQVIFKKTPHPTALLITESNVVFGRVPLSRGLFRYGPRPHIASDDEVEDQLLQEEEDLPNDLQSQHPQPNHDHEEQPQPPSAPPKPRRIMGLDVPDDVDIHAPRTTCTRSNSVTMPGFYKEKNQEARGSSSVVLLESQIGSLIATHNEIRDQYGEDFTDIDEASMCV